MGPVEEELNAFEAGAELALDFCRSRKVTLDGGWSLSLQTEEQKNGHVGRVHVKDRMINTH